MIGDHDNTAPGKQLAPPELRAQLGHYPELAKAAVARMKRGRLIEFPDLGHSPQIQDPAAFHQALLAALGNP
jgi:pimeloyl-ACP methyl ester carboxylesterase